MIFVTLGTQDKPFKRLIKAVEKQIELGNIKEHVIVQSGCTKYKSKQESMKIIDYMPIEEFNKYLEDARIIISQSTMILCSSFSMARPNTGNVRSTPSPELCVSADLSSV